MTDHSDDDNGFRHIADTMEGATRRAGQWKLAWEKRLPDLAAVAENSLVSNFFRDAAFNSAFLAAKRKSRRPPCDLIVRASVVQSCHAERRAWVFQLFRFAGS
jgi:hypothetical protein